MTHSSSIPIKDIISTTSLIVIGAVGIQNSTPSQPSFYDRINNFHNTFIKTEIIIDFVEETTRGEFLIVEQNYNEDPVLNYINYMSQPMAKLTAENIQQIIQALEPNFRELKSSIESVDKKVSEIKSNYITDEKLNHAFDKNKLKWYGYLWGLIKYSISGIGVLLLEHYNTIISWFSKSAQ